MKNLPDETGVYIFKDSRGKIIYIGKARSLRKRVRSYFNRRLDSKTQAMAARIADIEYRRTASEAQAQILEASLIKAHQPKYNIDLKDDKSFPWIRITNEKFPVVSICRVRRPEKPCRSLYFGPYTNANLLRQALRLIRKVFGFRSCAKMPSKPCLYYRLKACPAPCAGKISIRQYNDIIRQIELFLNSRHEELISRLSIKMQDFSRQKKFEKAAVLRDKIGVLSALAGREEGFNCYEEMEDLKRLLKLKKAPLRIEAFDISDISGRQAAGSMVSFYKASPDKDNYRRFRIRSAGKIDDYAMITEVINRRYSRLLKENRLLPDLILIDGGKGHLLTAQRELFKLGVSLPLISIAKQEESIYIPGKKLPVKLSSDTPALNLLRRVRDEAHRFALKYHHLLRRKALLDK